MPTENLLLIALGAAQATWVLIEGHSCPDCWGLGLEKREASAESHLGRGLHVPCPHIQFNT